MVHRRQRKHHQPDQQREPAARFNASPTNTDSILGPHAVTRFSQWQCRHSSRGQQCRYRHHRRRRPLSIGTQPASANIDNGQSDLQSVIAANGTTPYTYQWYIDAPAATSAAPSAAPPAAPSACLAHHHHQYWVRITETRLTVPLGSAHVDSNASTITVDGALGIGTQPASGTIDNGQTDSLSVTPSNGTTPYTYQWFIGASGNTTSPIGGATGSTFNASPTSTTMYWVRVTDSANGSAGAAHVDSNTATVTVRLVPDFGALSSPIIAFGTPTTTLTGHLGVGTAFPTGSTVSITLNSVIQTALVDGSGNFTTTFNTASLSVANSPYTITYTFAGNSSFDPASDHTTTLTIDATTPVLTNPTATSVTSTIATLGGTVGSNGGASLIKRGFLYAPSGVNLVLNGAGVTEVDSTSVATGVFTQNLTGLKPNSAYSFVAFATNGQGAGYSPVGNFTTTILGPISSITGPISGKPNDVLTFVLNGYDPVGDLQLQRFVFHIMWGDGKTNVVTGFNGTQTTHAYAANGTYTIQVSATDAAANILPTGTWKVTISSSSPPGANPAAVATNGKTTPVASVALVAAPAGGLSSPSTPANAPASSSPPSQSAATAPSASLSAKSSDTAAAILATVLADWSAIDITANQLLDSLASDTPNFITVVDNGFLGH